MATPPETEQPPQATQPPAKASVTPAAPSRWTAGRIALIVAGSVLALIALGVMSGGGYGIWLDTTQRSGGYVMTSSERFATGGYALATRTLHVSSEVPSFLYGRDWLGNVRIRGESANPNQGLFIGIARKADVDRYLAGVAHSEVVDVNADAFGTNYRPSYVDQLGGRPAIPPGRAAFWAARAAGQGSVSLTWSVKPGRWAVVVMRPDASRGVIAMLAAGAELPALLWVSIVVLVLGILIACGAGAMIYFGAREPRRTRGPMPPVATSPAAAPPAA